MCKSKAQSPFTFNSLLCCSTVSFVVYSVLSETQKQSREESFTCISMRCVLKQTGKNNLQSHWNVKSNVWIYTYGIWMLWFSVNAMLIGLWNQGQTGCLCMCVTGERFTTFAAQINAGGLRPWAILLRINLIVLSSNNPLP